MLYRLRITQEFGIGAFMGYRIIAEIAGLKVRRIGQNIVEIADGRWHGYLANISPS